MEDAADPATAMMTVNLATQTIALHDGQLAFEIDPQRRARLLDGVDDIADALRFDDTIAAHEIRTRAEAPWLADARLRCL
jgi:3-isopropylmalate/(R)-2-methylmalate dehydratase small subunit